MSSRSYGSSGGRDRDSNRDGKLFVRLDINAVGAILPACGRRDRRDRYRDDGGSSRRSSRRGDYDDRRKRHSSHDRSRNDHKRSRRADESRSSRRRDRD